jgi:hypothetical protein
LIDALKVLLRKKLTSGLPNRCSNARRSVFGFPADF